MKFQELQSENSKLQKNIEEIQGKNENLEKELNSQKMLIQTLKEKREASLHEIHKLTNEIQFLKSSISANTPKIKSSTGITNQGFAGAVMDSSSSVKITNSNKKEELKQEDLFLKKDDSIVRKEEINTPAKSALMKKRTEAKYLGMTKKELENLYREMLEVMLPLLKDPELNKAFIKVEKKLNDAIRRAQDHIDTLQDM